MSHLHLHGHGGEASELKQQGAFEAAQDPSSSVTAADAEKKALEESKKAGAAAFRFDPDASAEDKVKQAKAVSPRPSFASSEYPLSPNSPSSLCGDSCPR